MSRANTVTKLSLADFAKYLGIHPLHFEQVRMEETPNAICSEIIFQHSWQTADHVSREDIAFAIAEAEERIENVLGYHLCPDWEVDEWHMTTRPNNPELFNLNAADIRGLKSTVQANWGWVISGGIKSSELIEAGSVIVWSDEDGDTIDDTGTVSFATTVVDKNEIHIYYPSHSGESSWEIRPINVVISSGTATITFKRELTVIESKLEAYDIEGAEALYSEDSHFLTEVDVYRIYNDPQTQANFLWEPFATVCGTCGGTGCATCAYSTQNGCLILRSDPRNGIVGFSPGTWDNDEDIFVGSSWALGRMPEVIRLYYYSGWRNKNSSYVSRLDERWARTVSYMAAALLDRPPCECSANNWGRWRLDMALDSGDEDGRPIFRTPTGILDNPFGTTRGEVYAWRTIMSLSDQREPILKAVSL